MSDNTPFVSVLVTVYNRELYLRETLQSILASSYQDFEVIVVDDRSADHSVEIGKEIEANDDRVRLIVNDQNLGDYGNRMKAASLARGDFLKYVDSDDLIYPHALEVMVRSMERYPDAAVGLAHSMAEDDSPYPWRLTAEQAYRKHFLGRGCMSCGPTGAIIRRSVFETIGGFRPEWGVLSDSDLWFRIAAVHPIVLLPPGLVWWRRHPGQEFSKDGAAIDYLQRGFELDMLHLNDSACPLSENDRDQALRIRQHRMARHVLSLALKQRRLGLANQLYKASGLSVGKLIAAFKSQS